MQLLKIKIASILLVLMFVSCEEVVIKDISVSGRVYYSTNNKPVSSMTVSIKETVSTGSYAGWRIVSSTITDSTGYYSLTLINAQQTYFVDFNSYPDCRGECPIERISGITPGTTIVQDVYLDADTLTC